MSSTFDEIAGYAKQAGVTGLLLVAIYVLLRGGVVTGDQYNACITERNYWIERSVDGSPYPHLTPAPGPPPALPQAR